jgi:hypothetical protein
VPWPRRHTGQLRDTIRTWEHFFLGSRRSTRRGDGSAAMGRGPRREHVTGEGGRTTCCKRRGRAFRLLVAAAEKEPGRLRCSAGGMSTEGRGRIGNLVPVRVRVRVPGPGPMSGPASASA